MDEFVNVGGEEGVLSLVLRLGGEERWIFEIWFLFWGKFE